MYSLPLVLEPTSWLARLLNGLPGPMAANATNCFRASAGPRAASSRNKLGMEPGAVVTVVGRASPVRSVPHGCFCNKSAQTQSIFHHLVLRFDKTVCLLVLKLLEFGRRRALQLHSV